MSVCEKSRERDWVYKSLILVLCSFHRRESQSRRRLSFLCMSFECTCLSCPPPDGRTVGRHAIMIMSHEIVLMTGRDGAAEEGM